MIKARKARIASFTWNKSCLTKPTKNLNMDSKVSPWTLQSNCWNMAEDLYRFASETQHYKQMQAIRWQEAAASPGMKGWKVFQSVHYTPGWQGRIRCVSVSVSVSECIICRSSLAQAGQAVADRVTHVAVAHYGVSERATACITMTLLSRGTCGNTECLSSALCFSGYIFGISCNNDMTA